MDRAGRAADADLGAVSRGLEDRRRPCQHHRRSQGTQRTRIGLKDKSLDDLPASAPRPAREPETVVRRVDRASPQPDKITRAEELRLQLADEIVRGVLPPGAALDEPDSAKRFNVS